MHSHWNTGSNYSRDQRLNHYQQERGHSRVYHGHDVHDNNFGSDYREPTSRIYPTYFPTQNYPTNDNYPSNQNYRKLFPYTTEQSTSQFTNDLRKHNRNHQCTRNNGRDSGDCEIRHQVENQCTRRHSDNNCLHSPPCPTPCQTTCETPGPCMAPKNCPCSMPSTTCATLPPKCKCNANCRCFDDACANTPCSPFRRNENNDNLGFRKTDNTDNTGFINTDNNDKDEMRKTGEFHYYDLSPNLAIRSGEHTNEGKKETFQSSLKDEWLEHDITTEGIFPRFSPKIKYDHKQVKAIVMNKRNDKQNYDYMYDSSYSRERKRRNPIDEITFKPFWQMDEFNRGKSTSLKPIRYTTLYNKKLKKTRRTTQTVSISQTTETITVQLKDGSNIKQNQKKIMTEKYLSFDELMHLRKITSTEVIDTRRYGNTENRPDSSTDGRRADTSKTPEYTTNTPFMRKKYCTRKLTCTWTAPTVINAEGSVIVPGLDGDRGSRTPPGYVEGCTRTSTCTRDFMDRNKFSTITEETGSGEPTVEDEDYCEKRALDVRKRDSDVTVYDVGHQTYTDIPYTDYITYTYNFEEYENTSTTMSLIPTSTENCVCDDQNLRTKRNSHDTIQYHHNMSYGDLYYLVLQKILQRWHNNQNVHPSSTCLCNSSVLIRGSLLLLLFIFLYDTIINSFI